MNKSLIKGDVIEFKPVALETLRSPGVYVYVRGDVAVYVGASSSVIGRSLARNHHKKHELFKDCSLLIFPCESLTDARELEEQLIEELQPEHNQRGGWKHVAKLLGYSSTVVARNSYKQL